MIYTTTILFIEKKGADNIYSLEHFDREGKLINKNFWAILFESDLYRIIKFNDLGNIQISTIWLGFNANILSMPIVIFETMVYQKEPYSQLEILRYETEEQAIEGHKKVLEEYSQQKENIQ